MPLRESENQVREGPWLDRLFPIRLRNGRVVAVAEFSVLPTYVGILEGGLDPEQNAQQRQKIVALAAKRHGNPVVVVEPKIEPLPELSARRVRERYPWMACIARLISQPVVEDGFNAWSQLTLVWWQDAFDAPMPVEIERAAAGLEWERSARDVEFW
jgi:hypothetical protein